MFLGVSHAPIPRDGAPGFPKFWGPYVRPNDLTYPRGGPSVPQIFGTSYMRAHNMRNNNQLLHGDQTRCEENFCRSTDDKG